MLEIENKEDLEQELANNKKVLILFYASWCPYCRSFVPLFDKKANLTSTKVIHVLLDDYDNPMWDDFDIAAVPTVILFEEGKISSRLDGRFGVGLNERQFATWLQTLEL